MYDCRLSLLRLVYYEKHTYALKVSSSEKLIARRNPIMELAMESGNTLGQWGHKIIGR